MRLFFYIINAVATLEFTYYYIIYIWFEQWTEQRAIDGRDVQYSTYPF